MTTKPKPRREKRPAERGPESLGAILVRVIEMRGIQPREEQRQLSLFESEAKPREER